MEQYQEPFRVLLCTKNKALSELYSSDFQRRGFEIHVRQDEDVALRLFRMRTFDYVILDAPAVCDEVVRAFWYLRDSFELSESLILLLDQNSEMDSDNFCVNAHITDPKRILSIFSVLEDLEDLAEPELAPTEQLVIEQLVIEQLETEELQSQLIEDQDRVERRKSHRAQLYEMAMVFPVLRNQSWEARGSLLDISAGGARVRVDRELSPGEEVRLRSPSLDALGTKKLTFVVSWIKRTGDDFLVGLRSSSKRSLKNQRLLQSLQNRVTSRIPKNLKAGA